MTVDNTLPMPVCKICDSKKTVLRHKKYKYRYYRCNNCLTLFLSPAPSQKMLDMYYQKEFNYSAGIVEERKINQLAKHIMNNLLDLNHDGQNLLDIGSGYGVFLGEAKKHLQNVIGIEPSKSLYSYSKSYIKQHMMNINLQDFLKKNKNKYDFITLIHVIEHLSDPKTTLIQIISLLKPNGILYIETPNVDSYLYYAERENYTFLTPPDHIWLFSPQSFKELLKKFKSIQIEKFSTYSHPEHFMGILKRKLQEVGFLQKKRGDDMRFEQTPKVTLIRGYRCAKNVVSSPSLKYLFFDKFLATLLTPFMNFGNKGSILEIYLKKV